MKIREKLIIFKFTSKSKAIALQTLMEILGKQVPLNMLYTKISIKIIEKLIPLYWPPKLRQQSSDCYENHGKQTPFKFPSKSQSIVFRF